MDSDLEAFSHNPTDGSFSALASQLTENTKYLNQRLLTLGHQRYLLTDIPVKTMVGLYPTIES